MNATAEPDNPHPFKKPIRLDTRNLIFLLLSPILGIPGTIWYTWTFGFEWWMPALFLALYGLVGLSVTAGYHRCFSHRAYECSYLIQIFYAIFGAMSLQNSILWWSSGHRKHHAHTDQEFDPYNIKRGFWWAHFIWVLDADPEKNRLSNVPDLEKMPLVAWQHTYIAPLLIGFGFGLPALIGWFFGDWIAGLLWGGFLRITLVHHSTFFINSLAHYMGQQAYDKSISARDSSLLALLTFGEGYHSYHHRFPSDYRNGVRWWNWDPAKWFISGLKSLGLAWNLRATSDDTIEAARQNAMGTKRPDAIKTGSDVAALPE